MNISTGDLSSLVSIKRLAWIWMRSNCSSIDCPNEMTMAAVMAAHISHSWLTDWYWGLQLCSHVFFGHCHNWSRWGLILEYKKNTHKNSPSKHKTAPRSLSVCPSCLLYVRLPGHTADLVAVWPQSNSRAVKTTRIRLVMFIICNIFTFQPLYY